MVLNESDFLPESVIMNGNLCPSCGHEIDSSRLTCPKCGNSSFSSPEVPVFPQLDVHGEASADILVGDSGVIVARHSRKKWLHRNGRKERFWGRSAMP